MTHRRLRTLLVFVLALLAGGAIVNVAVAWGCAVSFEKIATSAGQMQIGRHLRDESKPVDPSKPYKIWSIMSERRAGAIRVDSNWHDGTLTVDLADSDGWNPSEPETLVPHWCASISPAANPKAHGTFHVRVAEGWGWPTPSLYALWICDADLEAEFPGMRLTGGFKMLSSPRARAGFWLSNEARAVPLLPIWPGFAINAVFYAAVLWVLLAVPGFIRRRFIRGRARRGLCPACAYPIRGGTNPACTECGGPVKRQQAMANGR